MIFNETQLAIREVRGKKQKRYHGMEKEAANSWSALHLPYSSTEISSIDLTPKSEAERLNEILGGK